MRGARTDLVNMGGDSLLHVASAFGKYDVVMKVRCLGRRRGGMETCHHHHHSICIMLIVCLHGEHKDISLFCHIWSFSCACVGCM